MWRICALVEISAPKNAAAVFDHFSSTGINIFSLKRGCALFGFLDDVPFSYKEGSVFLSAKPVMPW